MMALVNVFEFWAFSSKDMQRNADSFFVLNFSVLFY